MKRKRRQPRRVYVCGPITLYAKTDYGRASFTAASARIRARGDIAVSPIELDECLWHWNSRTRKPPPEIMTRRRVLAFDIGFVVPTCDVVYALRDWSKSSGARAEIAAALTYGLTVEFDPGAESPDEVAFWPKGIRSDGVLVPAGGRTHGKANHRRGHRKTTRGKRHVRGRARSRVRVSSRRVRRRAKG